MNSVRRSRFKRRFYKDLGILGLFTFSMLLIGPLIHEATHMAWLSYRGCVYTADLGFGLTGLHGHVQPVCYMKDVSLLVFYSTGYAATLTFGGLLNTVAVRIQGQSTRYIYYLSAGTGLMISVVLGLVSKGDFAEFFEVMGFNPVYAQIFTAALMVLIFVSNFKSIDRILSELEWKE